MKKFLIAAAMVLAAATQGNAMDSLSQFDWSKRVLVLFGDPQNGKLQEQVRLLREQKTGLAEREMVVLQVSGNDVHVVFGDAKPVNAGQLRTEADAESDGFEAVLVGKDGGVKLRSKQVVSDVEMFDLIDRMPMRRAGRG
ncbi:DUF4174 domain-containing protein [Neorhizobium sp. NPDC001467]|uniref:DUF4174 domain-containing protein n=1 Tax=Neorhizobium sp. NPDC001467 TaxID=3390595 RepID=UPI003D089ECC